jgi:sugar phosphate isomerase/epimerase
MANAPTSWGIEDPADPANPPWQRVLDEVAGAAAGLTDTEWATLIGGVHALARLAREEHGIVPCFHPHAGTHVEFEDEIERLVASTDPELVRSRRHPRQAGRTRRRPPPPRTTAALRGALDDHGFDGWAAVEQDRLPTDSASPAEHAAESLRHLRALRLAA